MREQNRQPLIEVKKIESPAEKSEICGSILHALPKWFGVEASIREYCKTVRAMDVWAAFDTQGAVGFAAIKRHNAYTYEIAVMGILEGYHGKGIGRRLIGCCEDFLVQQDGCFLSVKTLDASAPSRSYANTRKFYHAMGFRPVEVFPLFWDKENPCLLMIKAVSKSIEPNDAER